MKKLQGTFTALVTPFKGKNSNAIDYDALHILFKQQLKAKVDGIVILGTTGESPTITDKEQEKLIRFSVEKLAGKCKVIVGTGGYCTHGTIDRTKRAEDLGADAALIVTPYYNKPTNEGIYRHFKSVDDAVNLPIIVYNIAGRTGRNIDTDTMKRIADLDNVKSIKEASGSIEQIMEVIDAISLHRKDFSILSGDDNITFPLICLGGHGVISVLSNLIPIEIVELVKFALAGDLPKARQIHYRLLHLFKVAFIETNPIPIKEALNMTGTSVGSYRLPLCEMRSDNKAKLKSVLQQLDLV